MEIAYCIINTRALSKDDELADGEATVPTSTVLVLWLTLFIGEENKRKPASDKRMSNDND